MQHSIIYLAYGNVKFHKQTIFSVYSLLHLLVDQDPQELQIVIYTDRPQLIPKHALIRTRLLNRRDIARLRGARRCPQRIKLGILALAAREQAGPCIYVDSNTQWLQHPGPAFARLASTENRFRPVMFLHRFEVEIQPFIWPDYYQELTAGYELQGQLGIAKPWVMWNASALGFAAPADFFEKAIAFTDSILTTTRKRKLAAKLAVSLLANSRYDVQPLDTYVKRFPQHGYKLSLVIESALAEADQRSRLRDRTFVCSVYPVEAELARLRLTPLKLLVGRLRKLTAFPRKLRRGCRAVYSRI